VALLLAAVLAGACGSGAPAVPAAADGALNGLVRTPVPTVSLEPVADIAGAPFTFRAEPGRMQLLYFGYLSCPDVCPTTLADLRVATDELGPLADRVDVAMITIDPVRDTAENLRAYLDHFLPRARGLVLGEPGLRTVADAFGAVYAVEQVDGEPQVSHSAFVYVVDDAGRLLVQWPFGTPAADLRNDLVTLLQSDPGERS